MFVFHHERIDSIPTDIWTKEGSELLQIILIPGNPGVASFYLEFANILSEFLKIPATFHCISYAGFNQDFHGKLYSLTEEIEHKKSVYHFLKKSWKPKTKVWIIGHSIGGYIGIELLKEVQKDYESKLVQLFPFLRVGTNPKLLQLKDFLENSIYVKLTRISHKLIRKIPPKIIDSLIPMIYPQGSDSAKNVILEYLHSKEHILDSCIYLSQTEFKILPNELPWDSISKYSNDIVWFYCLDDIYAPISQWEEIKDKVVHFQGSVISNVNHDFCTNTEQCKLVSEEIVKWIEN
jgi:hypothetical protein